MGLLECSLHSSCNLEVHIFVKSQRWQTCTKCWAGKSWRKVDEKARHCGQSRVDGIGNFWLVVLLICCFLGSLASIRTWNQKNLVLCRLYPQLYDSRRKPCNDQPTVTNPCFFVRCLGSTSVGRSWTQQKHTKAVRSCPEGRDTCADLSKMLRTLSLPRYRVLCRREHWKGSMATLVANIYVPIYRTYFYYIIYDHILLYMIHIII